MSRARILLLVLLIAGCAQSPGSTTVRHRIDTSCMQDCLGNQGDRQFCEDRCSF